MDRVVEEYEDIFTSPAGVPLHCQVKHPINLTLGAPFPNGPIYQCFILDNEKIKRQIQELLQKGRIRRVHHLVGARSCWCRRRMGLGDFAFTIRH